MTTLMEGWIQIQGQPLVHALGWTLLHFCWQGVAVAGLLWCMLALLGGRSSQARYCAACCALALLVVLPLVTFSHIASAELKMRSVAWDSAVPIDAATIVVVGADGPPAPWLMRAAVAIDQWVPWLLVAWFVGVVLFVVRLNLGLVLARTMKSEGTHAPPAELLRMFDALRSRLGIARAVTLLHSALVEVPTVIGWLRPVVLIPVSCLTGLSMEQIEAIFCHELAHVRRHDYLVSVLQSVVEALLFYHPAVWWVSKQVRRERECCCDEAAVEMGSDVLAYARALSWLEEHRASFPEFVLGANGGVLTLRIKRLLGCKVNTVASQLTAAIVMTTIMAIAGSYVVTTARAQAKAAASAALAASDKDPAVPQQEAALERSAVDPGVSLPARGARPMLQQQVAATDAAALPLHGAYKVWLEQDVRWIITEAEVQAFKNLTKDEERDAFIENFWQRRNPNPDAPDNAYRNGIYARIAYANENFASGKPGWMTDRGHIYIAYGKPDDIESHRSGGDTSSYPFESWHYRYIPGIGDNVTLQFVDTCRCGEFHYTIDRVEQPDAVDYLQRSTTLAAQVLAPPAVPPPPPPFVPGRPVHMSSGSLTLVSKTDVVYPPIAIAAHVQGTVVLHAIISKTGAVGNVQVVSGLPMLTSSAMDAVRQWTYKPFAPSGEPLEVDTTIAIAFRLSDDGTPTVGVADPDPIRVSGGVMAGALISKVDPVYPAEARSARVQGAVVLKVTISKTGTIKDLQVVSGPPELMSSAIDAVRQWTYKPYLLNGEPVEVQTTITVNFSLEGAAQVQRNPAVLHAVISRPVSFQAPATQPSSGAVQGPGNVGQVRNVRVSQTDMRPAQADGSISGTVFDPTGALVPRAKVTAVNTDTGVQTVRETDGTGKYSLSPLPAGVYNVEFEAKGFQRLLQENVRVEGKQPAGLNVKLSVGAVSEALTVTGAPVVAAPPPPPPTVAAAASKPVGPQRVSSGTTAGRLISKVDPVYPAEARAAHVQGVVVLLATISKAGTIENVRVASGPEELLVCAIDAVRQWKYSPYLLNGEPTEAHTMISITFTLDGSVKSQGQGVGADSGTPQ